jgi:hypothetical protein
MAGGTQIAKAGETLANIYYSKQDIGNHMGNNEIRFYVAHSRHSEFIIFLSLT